jgi:hypothetical protein
MIRTKSGYVPFTCVNLPDVRSGPFLAPLASMPWQFLQLRAWKIESPVVTIAVVTPAGNPLLGRAAAAEAAGDVELDAGAAAVVEPPLWHAPRAAAAKSTRVGRAKKMEVMSVVCVGENRSSDGAERQPDRTIYEDGGLDVRSRCGTPSPSSANTGSCSPHTIDARRTAATIAMPIHVDTPRQANAA